MNLQHAPVATAKSTRLRDAGGRGLQWPLFLLARLLWLAIFLLLFWGKSTDRSILLISLVLILMGRVFFPPIPCAFMNDGAWWVSVDILEFLGGFLLIFVCTFPDGRFVPDFTRWVVLLISNRCSCWTRSGKKRNKRRTYSDRGMYNGSRTPIGHDTCGLTVLGGQR